MSVHLRAGFALLVVLSQLQLFPWKGPSLHLRDFALLLEMLFPLPCWQRSSENTPKSVQGRALMLEWWLEAKLPAVFKLMHSSGSVSRMGTVMGRDRVGRRVEQPFTLVLHL